MANIVRQNNVLCKSLKTVETLGSMSVICSNKTRTLAMVNAMDSIYCLFTDLVSRTRCMLLRPALEPIIWIPRQHEMR